MLAAVLHAAACGVSGAGELLLRVDGPRGACTVSPAGGGFELSWEHSVERTRWREKYEIDEGGEVVLTESVFASAGAGLPDRLAEGERFRAGGGTLRIEGRRVIGDELRVRLSAGSRHMLRVGTQTTDLNDRFGEGVVTIRAVRNQTGKGECR